LIRIKAGRHPLGQPVTMSSPYGPYLERAVPRYTSYPTAPHFHAGIDADCYARWLAELEPGTTLSLYFHVPFCAQMCWYCGCHTKVVRHYDPVAVYAATLAAEIDLVATRLGRRHPVLSVHFGGGTPTMLSERDFTGLLDRVRRRFDLRPGAEIAVEIDPRTLTPAMARAMGRAGVTRASIGVQDFNAHVQRAINREQSFERTATAVRDLRANGIDKLNVDLMYGLPHQGEDDLLRTVDRSIELAPDRVALFGYAHVPWMKSHQRLIDESALPDGQARLGQAQAAARRLIAHGYRRVGLDHFARADDSMARALDAGRLKRNFQGYTVDPAEVLMGFGASAIGSLAQGYVQNAVPIKTYRDRVRSGRLPTAAGIALDAEDRLRREVIERLMCESAVDLDALLRAHGAAADHFDRETRALRTLERDGIVRLADRRVEVTEAGRPFVRTVCAAFDSYLARGEARHSRAV
jgi:oxygen-independent coproporphyrinogen-3 oxidase